MKHLTFAAIAAMAVSATPAIAQNDDGPECVRLTNINGYSVIDRRHVVLRGGASRHYLVTTRHNCPGLNFGVELGTTFRDNQTVCPPVVEYIVPDDGFRCAIDTVEHVEDVESARSLIEARAETADNGETD